jgi:hypothetical protein
MPQTQATRSRARRKHFMQIVSDGSIHPDARPLATDREVWEKQPGESDKAWVAFRTYRDMLDGKRSISRLARELERSRDGTLAKWSTEWQWPFRCEEFERSLDAERQREMRQEIVKMAQRHAQQAQLFMSVLSQPAMALMRKVQADPTFFDRMLKSAEGPDGALNVGMTFELLDKLQKFARAFPEVAQLERLARGEPTHIEQRQEVRQRNADAQMPEFIINDEENSRLAAELFQRINRHIPAADDDDDDVVEDAG